MGFLANILGGKKYLVWLIGFFLAVIGKLGTEYLHQLTMVYMVSEGAQGIFTKSTNGSSPVPAGAAKIWTMLGGRKLSAFLATTALLIIQGYAPEQWLQVGYAYVGAEVLEKSGLAVRGGIQSRLKS